MNTKEQIDHGLRLARECAGKYANEANWHALRAHLERMTKTIPGGAWATGTVVSAEASDRHFACEFEVWQGDEMQASASGPRDTALREAMHYAAQYGQDGPVRVFEVMRILVSP